MTVDEPADPETSPADGGRTPYPAEQGVSPLPNSATPIAPGDTSVQAGGNDQLSDRRPQGASVGTPALPVAGRQLRHVAPHRLSGPSWLPLIGSAMFIAFLVSLVALSAMRGNGPHDDSKVPKAPAPSVTGPSSER